MEQKKSNTDAFVPFQTVLLPSRHHMFGLDAFGCKSWLHGLGFEPRQTCAYENLSLTPWTSRAPVRLLLSRGQVVCQRQAIRPVFSLKFLAMFKCEFLRIHETQSKPRHPYCHCIPERHKHPKSDGAG